MPTTEDWPDTMPYAHEDAALPDPAIFDYMEAAHELVGPLNFFATITGASGIIGRVAGALARCARAEANARYWHARATAGAPMPRVMLQPTIQGPM